MKVKHGIVWLWLGLESAFGQMSQAQLLPGLKLPQLPLVQPQINQTLSATQSLDESTLQRARALRVQELIRRHRALIEADPHGAAIVRGELLVVATAEEALQSAQAQGFTIAREQLLDGLDLRIVILKATGGESTARALERLRRLHLFVTADFNHLYLQSGEPQAGGPTDETIAPSDRTVPAVGVGAATTLGLIDSGVDIAHPVFKDVPIQRHGCSGNEVPDSHGTAVASLMVGRAGEFHGASPGSTLYAADVYCGVPSGGAVDAIADALEWMVRQRVPVINLSLVGPPNAVLEAVVRSAVAHGHLLVAAVGNDGPAAPPLYPASYPGVVGVTAVDAHRHALVEAARGSQVSFAAPGADMSAACSPQGYTMVRGTSFAAPLVAGLLAMQLREPALDAAQEAIAALAREAARSGAPRRDAVLGYGLVGVDLAPTARLASAR